MKIAEHKVVVLTYELKADGMVADRATREKPLDYIHGTHMLIPRFEASVEGLEAGDTFSFTLLPEEGYGLHDPERVTRLPLDAFRLRDGSLAKDLLIPGTTIPMTDGDGQVVLGTVLELDEETVTMDFNHPMAGKTLDFTGEILSVRDASEKELKVGLHGEFLPREGHSCCHGGKGHCKHHGEGHGDGEGCCHGGGDGCCHKDGHAE